MNDFERKIFLSFKKENCTIPSEDITHNPACTVLSFPPFAPFFKFFFSSKASSRTICYRQIVLQAKIKSFISREESKVTMTHPI